MACFVEVGVRPREALAQKIYAKADAPELHP
jgi:hypothetical protein